MKKKLILQKPSLYHLILAWICSFMYKDQAVIGVPSKIGKYVLQKEVVKENPYNFYATGIYTKDKSLFFVKTWKGKRKDFRYYSLLNEYLCGKVLSKKIKQSSSLSFRIPEIVEVISKNNMVSVVFEYIKGNNLSKYSYSKQGRIISDILYDFFQLSRALSAEDYKYLTVRTRKYYFLSFPVRFLFASLFHKKERIFFLKNLIPFTKKIVHLKQRNLVLSHGDLHPSNIIITKDNSCILVDLGRTMLTIPEYDISNLSLSVCYSQIKRAIDKKIMKYENGFIRMYIAIRESHIKNPFTGTYDFLNTLKAVT